MGLTPPLLFTMCKKSSVLVDLGFHIFLCIFPPHNTHVYSFHILVFVWDTYMASKYGCYSFLQSIHDMQPRKGTKTGCVFISSNFVIFVT